MISGKQHSRMRLMWNHHRGEHFNLYLFQNSVFKRWDQPRMFLWPTSSHIHGLILPLGRSRACSFHAFSCCSMEQSFRAALISLPFQPQWWIWCLKPNFLSFLDSYQNKAQKACHVCYNPRRIITAAANYSRTQIQFLKTTHSSLQEKPNDFFPPSKYYPQRSRRIFYLTIVL